MMSTKEETIRQVKPHAPKLSGKSLFANIGFFVFLVTGIIIGISQPFPLLTPQAHRILMSIIIVLGMWIFKPLNIPYSVSSCFFMMLCLVFGLAPADVFSGFTSSALWVLIPALFFGFVLLKTGLGKRIAYFVIKLFKPSVGSMILAWVIIGVVLSILTPSITVRTAIIIPIAAGCVQVLKLEEGSAARSLIMLVTFAMGMIPGSGWLTGSLTGPIALGMYEAVPQLQGLLTFSSYSQVALLPVELSGILLIIFGWFILKPKHAIAISEEDFQREFSQLPPLSRDEIITGIVLVVAFAFFVTSSWHHINDAAICLGAFFLLAAAGIIKKNDIGPGITWDLVIFIGASIGLGAICKSTGISAWMSGIIIPALKPIAGNPYLFTFCMTVFLFAWRFVDVARFLPTMAILVPILPDIQQVYGISPLVWVPLFAIAINSFIMSYTNIWALQSESMVHEKIWTPSHMAKFGLIHFASSLIALMIAVPYWISIGMFR